MRNVTLIPTYMNAKDHLPRLSLKRGTIAGPDPWKANTLEWFTPSPPPENNFDVIPRVRSVEPMKDIRRQIERQTGVRQRYEAGKPMTVS